MSRRPTGYAGAAQAIRKAARDEAFNQAPPVAVWRVTALGPMTLEPLQSANLSPISIADDDVEQLGAVDTVAAVGDRAYVHRTATGDYVIAGLVDKNPSGSPTGPAAGDLGGAYPNPEVHSAQPDFAVGGKTIVEYLVPTGVHLPFGGDVAPPGFLLCNGGSYLRADYPDLFAVIGTKFGAADGTHFNVPDMRDHFAIGASGTRAVGATGGTETETLALFQIPSHTHGVGTLAVGAESSHTHGVGTLAFAGSAVTSGAGSSHSHGATGLTFAGSAVTSGTQSADHSHSGTTSTESADHTHDVSTTYTAGRLRADLSTGGSAGAVQDAFGSTNVGNNIGSTGGRSAAHTHSITTGGVSASHSHSVTAAGTIGGSTATEAAHTHSVTAAGTISGATAAGSSHTHTLSGSTGSQGSGGAHNNVPPYVAMNWIVKT